MIEERIKFALDTFLVENYFAIPAESYVLKENDPKGKSVLNLYVGNTDNLCKPNYDAQLPHFSFIRTDNNYKIDKCIDHFLLIKRNKHWELHMFEMKTTLSVRTWDDVRRKMRASYLKIKALLVFLGIKLADKHIFAYTTYEKVDLSISNNKNLKIFMPLIGKRAFDIEKNEWLKNCLYLPLTVDEDTNYYKSFIKIPHRGIQMHRNKDEILYGNFNL